MDDGLWINYSGKLWQEIRITLVPSSWTAKQWAMRLSRSLSTLYQTKIISGFTKELSTFLNPKDRYVLDLQKCFALSWIQAHIHSQPRTGDRLRFGGTVAVSALMLAYPEREIAASYVCNISMTQKCKQCN
jgi:hypothetical protein